MNLSAGELHKFRHTLLYWFHRKKRDLPWRRTHNPYHIWVSEIMLQQTRVAAVLPYYQPFLERFPTVRELARARSEQVLKLWAGLGYYSRARNLHRAAREMVARHSGSFPRQLDDALRLPGIGRYTGSAVLSIAYGSPYAVLDGNVARVLARLSAVRDNLQAHARWTELHSTAQTLLARGAPGNWNQAMMELGATICTPRAPQCGACPVSRWCQARRLGIVEQVPGIRRKRAPLKITIAAAVLLDSRGRTLLMKSANEKSDGHENGVFSRMWQFPALTAGRHAQNKMVSRLLGSLRVAHSNVVPLAAARHTVTFREITLQPFLVRVECLPGIEGARRPSLTQIERLPISNATRKIAAAALQFLRTKI